MAGGRWVGFTAAVTVLVLVLARQTAGEPATSYIIDNPTPSREFGAAFAAKTRAAAAYPGPYTGALLPPAWAADLMDGPGLVSWLRRRVALGPNPPNGLAQFYDWVGATTVLTPQGNEIAVGANTVATPFGPAIAFGCTTCHSQNFFGTLVFGMANKGARANLLFARSKALLEHAPLALLGAASPDETALLRREQERLHSIGAKAPLALGLDTALAAVSLSLARRAEDGAATMTAEAARAPRPDPLDTARADSKPMDWWNVRYKDRYFSDGALVGGDVILTAILWNEIGRGSDLNEVTAWLKANPTVFAGIGTMVRSSVPPRIGDFLPGAVDVAAARRGEGVFLGQCASCHGTYEKNWASGFATIRVNYPKPTQVRSVGTDRNRADGMTYVAERLNRLDVSRKFGLVLEPTGAYVPPPLTGIWSRYPYLHNRSVPNLCELLKPSSARVARYYVGTTTDISTDYDADCVGYPTVNVPPAWQTRERLFDTRVTGLSNAGHERFTSGTESDKRDLIEYLKTL